MTDLGNQPTVIWAALLTSCDGQVVDLGAGDEALLVYAEQMTAAGILLCTEPHCYTLTSNGSRLLLLLERLRDYSLGIG